MYQKIAVIGPISPRGAAAPGGFEASNRRLCDALQSLGSEVFELPYQGGNVTGRIEKLRTYHAGFRNISREIKGLGSDVICHMTPLYKQFIMWEYWIARRAKKSGKKLVIDLRAGRLVKDYNSLGVAYRFMFKKFMRLADVISVEGKDFIPFIKEISPQVDIFYLPNFILDGEIPEIIIERNAVVWRFSYVGSVNEAKGILHSAKLIRALMDKGFPVQFDIFGKASEQIESQVQAIVRSQDIALFHGSQPYSTIQKVLEKSHFFLFLTKWHGEGHSNALTEAMSQGAIPVVTDHGFCKNVAEGVGIIVDDRDKLDKTIDEIALLIANPDNLVATGKACHDRVKNNFSQTAVISILKNIYKATTNS